MQYKSTMTRDWTDGGIYKVVSFGHEWVPDHFPNSLEICLGLKFGLLRKMQLRFIVWYY